MRMNSANQLKAKIKNLARQRGVDPRILLRIYMMERFLDRVANSDYKERFVLKGGMLISYLVGVELRTTMDIDTTVQNIPLTEQDVKAFILDILATEVNDGVAFQLTDLETIMEEADYPGIRVTMKANFDGTSTPVKIDLSTGHAITPRAIEAKLPLMFSEPIVLPVYPISTILAEKLQTILARAVFNTRMRDFYDVHALRTTQGDDSFRRDEIKKAFIETSKTRNTLYLIDEADILFEQIATSMTMKKRWTDYRNKTSFATGLSWEDVLQDVHFFLLIICT